MDTCYSNLLSQPSSYVSRIAQMIGLSVNVVQFISNNNIDGELVHANSKQEFNSIFNDVPGVNNLEKSRINLLFDRLLRENKSNISNSGGSNGSSQHQNSGPAFQKNPPSVPSSNVTGFQQFPNQQPNTFGQQQPPPAIGGFPGKQPWANQQVKEIKSILVNNQMNPPVQPVQPVANQWNGGQPKPNPVGFGQKVNHQQQADAGGAVTHYSAPIKNHNPSISICMKSDGESDQYSPVQTYQMTQDFRQIIIGKTKKNPDRVYRIDNHQDISNEHFKIVLDEKNNFYITEATGQNGTFVPCNPEEEVISQESTLLIGTNSVSFSNFVYENGKFAMEATVFDFTTDEEQNANIHSFEESPINLIGNTSISLRMNPHNQYVMPTLLFHPNNQTAHRKVNGNERFLLPPITQIRLSKTVWLRIETMNLMR